MRIHHKIPEEGLRHLLSAGLNQAQIAWVYGVTRQAVHQKVHYRSKAKQKERLARRLAAKGLSLSEIQKKLGHKQIISTRRLLVKHSIPFRMK